MCLCVQVSTGAFGSQKKGVRSPGAGVISCELSGVCVIGTEPWALWKNTLPTSEPFLQLNEMILKNEDSFNQYSTGMCWA